MLGDLHSTRRQNKSLFLSYFSWINRKVFNSSVSFLLLLLFTPLGSRGQIEVVSVDWQTEEERFLLNGFADTNLTVFEGMIYQITNNSSSNQSITMMEGDSNFSGMNPFNTLANSVHNYLYWEPEASNSRNLSIVNTESNASAVSVLVESYDYSQVVESPTEAGYSSNFGYSIHLGPGNRLLVGAPKYEAGKGRVYHYEFSENSKLYELSNFLESPRDNEGQFGGSLASSDDWLLVGSPMAGESAGAVNLFEREGSVYQPRSEINGTTPGLFFGLQTSMNSGEFAVSSMGKVELYRLDTVGNVWVKQENLTIENGVALDGFGYDLDYGGEMLVVGAPFHEGGGACFVYEKNAGGWNESEFSPISLLDESSQFGFSVALDSDSGIAAVAAPFANTFGNGSGAVHIFTLVNGVWEASQILSPPNIADIEQRFGYSLDLDGDVLAVAAPGSGTAGKVYIYRKSTEEPSWRLLSELDFAGEGIADSLDCNIVLDSQTLMIGASRARDENGTLAIYHGPGWKDFEVPVLPPLLSPSTILEFNISEDTTEKFIYDFNGTHPFGEPISWVIENENAYGESFFELNSSSGVFEYHPNQDFSGIHNFKMLISSQEESSTFDFRVNVTAVGDVPVFLENDRFLPDGSVGVPYSHQLLWEDVDMETPAFSIVSGAGSLPSGLDLDGSKIFGNPDSFGDHNFTIRMSDSFSLQQDKNFSLRVFSSNSAPSILWQGNEVPYVSLHLKEDFSMADWFNTISELNITDPDNDGLVLSIKEPFQQYQPKNGSLVLRDFDGSSSPITYFPIHNYYGADRFTLVVSDDHALRESTEIEFRITIDPVNDPPILVPSEVGGSILPDPLSLRLGDRFYHTFEIYDPDIADDVKLSFSTLPEWLTFDGNLTLEGTPWTEDFITDPTPGIFVYLSDLNGSVSTQYFELYLEPSNYPPEILVGGPVEFSLNEDSGMPFSFELNCTDPDSNASDLTWQISVEPRNGNVEFSTIGGNSTVVSYLPFADFSGDDSFEVKVFNPSFPDSSDTIIFSAEVNASEDTPQIISTPFTNLLVGVPWEYELLVYDPDENDQVTLFVTGLPYWLQYSKVTSNKWVFQGIPLNPNPSLIEIDLVVTDSFQNSSNQVLQLYLIETAGVVEIAPRFPDVQVLAEDNNWSIQQLSVAGGEDRKITWSFTKLPENGVVEYDSTANGVLQNLRYIPNANFHGNDSFTLLASDGFSTDEENFLFTIEQIDDATEWALPQDLEMEDEQFYDQIIAYYDGDGWDTLGDLNISIEPANSWIIIEHHPEEGKLRLHGHAPAGTNQNYSIGATLHDSQGVPVLEGNFSLSVNFYHSSPELEISSLVIGPILEDTNYTHSSPLLAQDDNTSSQDLIWSISETPRFGYASVDLNGSNLFYQPIAHFYGNDTFLVEVKDNGGAEEGIPKTAVMEVSVTVESVKDLPVFKSHPITTIVEGEKYIYEIEVFDPDILTETYPEIRASYALPDWLALNQKGGGKASLSGYPKFYHEGSHLIKLEFIDGDGDQIFQHFDLDVEVSDYPPKIIDRSDNKLIEKISLVVFEDQVWTEFMSLLPDFNATNPDDSDVLEWSVLRYPSSGNILELSGTGAKPSVFNYTLSKDFSGTDNFSIMVSEGDRNSTLDFEIYVTPTPDNPVWIDVPVGKLEVIAGISLSYQIKAADADSDSLHYQLSSGNHNSNWLQIEEDSGKVFLRGTAPSPDFLGKSFSYLLKVSDSSQRSSFAEFEIVSLRSQSPPKIISSAEPLAVLFDFDGSSAGSSKFPLLAEDLDGDTLYWSVVTEPKFGSINLAQYDGELLRINYEASQGYVEEDWFTLRVSDGSLYDEIEVHAFFDRRQTVVNVRDKLPPIFTGEFLSYEFSVFSNDGYDLLDAKVLSGPSWVNQLVSDGQPNEWMKSFTLTGMIPEGSEGEQEVIIEVSNAYGNYKEVFNVIIPIISRNRDMSGVKISILEESENIYEQHNLFKEEFPSLESSVPLDFQGNLAKILQTKSNYFLLGNFRGELNYDGIHLSNSERTAGFILCLDTDFKLLHELFFDSEIVCTIADGALSENEELIIFGNFIQDIKLADQQERGAGGNDLFLCSIRVEYDNMEVVDFLTIGGESDEVASSIVVDGSDIFISGSFRNETNFGSYTKQSVGLSDGFIAKTSIDLLRNFSWISSFGSSGRDQIRDIAMMDGEIYAVGNFENSLRVGNLFMSGGSMKSSFVATIDPRNGTVLHSFRIEGEGNIMAKGITVGDQIGKAFVFGEFDGQITTERSKIKASKLSDLFLLELSNVLYPESIMGIEGSGTEQWDNWHLGSDGYLYLSGNFDQSVDIMGSAKFSHGKKDAFLLKIDASSLRVVDYMLLQSVDNDRIEKISQSLQAGISIGTNSQDVALLPLNNSGGFSSSGNYRLAHFKNPPQLITQFPEILSSDTAFHFDFATFGWSETVGDYTVQVNQMPEWMNLKFHEENASGYFYGISPSIINTNLLNIKINSETSEEDLDFSKVFELKNSSSPELLSSQKDFEVLQDEKFSFSLNIYDHDANELWVYYDAPEWVQITSNISGQLTFQGVATGSAIGTHQINLRVKDDDLLETLGTYVLKVKAVLPESFTEGDFTYNAWVNSWFGTIFSKDSGWTYHESLGWVILKPEPQGEYLWLWNQKWGWLWTAQTIWKTNYEGGHLYSYSLQSWLYFKPAKDLQPALIYMQESEKWINY